MYGQFSQNFESNLIIDYQKLYFAVDGTKRLVSKRVENYMDVFVLFGAKKKTLVNRKKIM